MLTRRTWHSAKTKELTQQALEQVQANIWDGGKPEVYLQFALLEQFPQLMEPRNLRPETMKWNNTPRLFKRIPTLMHPIPSDYNHGGHPDQPSNPFRYA